VNTPYLEIEPARDEIDKLAGPVLVEFGAPWCEHCQAAQPLIRQALAEHARVRRVRIEDGPGRRLGRSFVVKLWPTLIFLERGREVRRLVRPAAPGELDEALAQIAVAT
jgi:thioredoxin 1